MQNSQRPIFIVSAPRSGSTLMRLVLDSHPGISIPPPSWLYAMVFPYLYSNGDLSLDHNIHALAEDIIKTPTVESWSFPVSPDQLVTTATERSFAGLYDALHRLYAQENGKVRWGEKSPRNCFWMDEIKRDFPDAQFVHIVRDGRDMAIDIANSPPMVPNNLYSGAQIWKAYNRAALDSAARMDGKSYYKIHYEALCNDPQKELRGLCQFLREDFDEAMLSHDKSPAAQTWSKIANHANVGRSITTEYCEMYRSQLPAGDRAALNACIGDLLKQLDYPLDDEPKDISARNAWQLLEEDSISTSFVLSYRQWHQQRRRDRKANAVWQDSDRKSLLRLLN
jgi:hypothetical protein